MFENHRQLIEAVQQDSLLPELRERQESQDVLAEGKNSDMGWHMQQGALKFARQVVAAIKKVAGPRAQKVEYRMMDAPGNFIIEYRGENVSDMDLYVLTEVEAQEWPRSFVRMVGKGAMMDKTKKVEKRGMTKNLTPEFLANMFKAEFFGM